MKFVLTGIVALFFVLLSGQDIFACSCRNPPTVEQSFEQSAAVFYGTVEDVNNYGEQIHARFKVEKSWKGADKDEALVITDATSCGIDFKIGESYYLFVDRDGGTFRTVPCRRHAGAQEDFLQNKPLIQLKPARPKVNNLLFIAVVLTGFIITLAVAAVTGIYFFKSRKSYGLKKE